MPVVEIPGTVQYVKVRPPRAFGSHPAFGVTFRQSKALSVQVCLASGRLKLKVYGLLLWSTLLCHRELWAVSRPTDWYCKLPTHSGQLYTSTAFNQSVSTGSIIPSPPIPPHHFPSNPIRIHHHHHQHGPEKKRKVLLRAWTLLYMMRNMMHVNVQSPRIPGTYRLPEKYHTPVCNVHIICTSK